ncbi:g_PROTEIN_RECEP_F1_2 domain-containing protein [Nephila pilipes]|uniref:G_PROTEIN_RECEP_F1_2 domain-containing protein n=1 Tax=Nephila pilipes TaxID=299642 RepID=A0A8X6U3E8_NEPPI|nr:g_PROTEIN_RECEP_F1_2 domain-containing protein [Nephila pilipes]
MCRVGSSEDMELRKLLMNEVDAAALRRMSNPSPPSSAPPKKQVSVRPSQDAVAATSHADDNEMDQCWDSESEDSPMNSGPLDLNSLAVYVANQTTIDGTLEAIRALRGQETRINSVNFPSEAEKDKYQHFLRELMEEATRKYKSLHDQSLSYLNSIGLADATQPFKTVSSKKKKNDRSTPASQGAKKQRTTNDAIESSTNRFNNLSVDEREEYISDDEDVTTPPPKKQPSKAEKMKSQTEERIRLKTILKEKRQPLRINRPVIHTTPTSYAQAAATKVIPTTQGIPESSTPTQAPLSNLQVPLDTFDQLKNPQVIEISWNNGQPNPTGTKIYNLTQSSDLDILVPNEPTRIPPNARSRPATIDFAITKGLSNTAIWTEPLLSSDHNPIFVTIQLQHHSKPRSTKLFTNWFKFQSILDSSIEGNPKISNTDEINSSIAQFTENITQAINQSSKLTSVIATAYIVAWFPYAIVCLYEAYGNADLVPRICRILAALFCKTAAATNPIIYLFMSKGFRREVREILSVLFKCGVFSTLLRNYSQKSSSLRSPSEVSLRSSWLSRVRSGSSRIRRKAHSTGSSSSEPQQHNFAESHV